MKQLPKRLRVEQLEARAMLSASYGGASYAPEQVEVHLVAWETGQPSELRVESDGRMSGPASAATAAAEERALPLVIMPPPHFWSNWQNPRPAIFVIHFTMNASTVVNTSLDIENTSGRSPEDVRPPLKFQTSLPQLETPSTSNPRNEWRPPSAMSRVSGGAYSTGMDVGGSLPSTYTYTPSQAAPTSARAMSTVSLRAQDAAFQNFSSQHLLLAAETINSSNEDEDGDVADDLHLSSLDEELDEVDAIASSRLRDDVAVSLENLQRERAVIDDVLTELHEIGPFAAEHGSAAARSRPADRSGEAERVFAAEARRTMADESHLQPALDVDDGGMVLLEASGDANSSAYDLTSSILLDAETTTAMPIGTEAAVGVYQAFDVGAVPPRTAGAKEAPRGNPVAYGEKIARGREGGA